MLTSLIALPLELASPGKLASLACLPRWPTRAEHETFLRFGITESEVFLMFVNPEVV